MSVKVRERPGKGWYVFIDWNGQRKAKYFGENEQLAKEFAKKMDAKLKLGTIGISTKSGIKLEAYAETWLERIQHTRKHTTAQDYREMLNRDILPVLRGLDLEDITRERVKAVAFAGLKKGQSPKTVQNTVRCLSSLLSYALEDGLITTNHALKPGKFLPRVSKRRGINPLTREETALLLETAKERLPGYYPILLCAVRTGLRQGELIALQWDDVDFHGRFLDVRRSYTGKRLGTPKSGESRRVDMSQGLTQVLRDFQMERQFQAAANGWKEVPPWIFCDEGGGLLHHNTLRQVFHRLLKAAGLRKVRFHDLRHTYASLLLQQGETPVYVKEQMGHSSIQVTVDLYGHLIPGGNRQAVDRLDQPVDKQVSEAESATQPQPAYRWQEPKTSQPIDLPNEFEGWNGVSEGSRTPNLWSHSPAL